MGAIMMPMHNVEQRRCNMMFYLVAFLAVMCILSCTNTKKDIEQFLKKEIVAEFSRRGIDAKILDKSLQIVPDGENRYRGSVGIVIDGIIYDHSLSVSIENETIKWQIEETETSASRRAQDQVELRQQEAMRQERERRRQEEAQRQQEEAQRRQEEELRRQEENQRKQVEHQARIYQDIQRIEAIKSQLLPLFINWRLAVIRSDGSEIRYMHTVNNLRDEADRLYDHLSWEPDIDKSVLQQDKRNFHDWYDDMLHQVTMAKFPNYY
jgi:Membrane protein involved in colicin uptake